MNKKRRILRWLMWGVIGVFLGAGLCIAISILRVGSVEAWVGHELSEIANHYLVPHLHIGKIYYRGNKTVDIQEMWLDADDPDEAGKKVRIFEVVSARLELEEVPRWGKPLRISELYLNKPVVRFVKGKAGGTLVGFAHFVAGQVEKAAASTPATQGPAEKVDDKATGKTRPSDVFQIHVLQIDDGTIEYDARAQGEQAEKLDGINSKMHVAREANTGWYGVQIEAGRKPVFDLTAKGRINVDTLQVGVKELVMELELSEKTKHYLPQNLQKFVEEYEMAGKLRLSVTGTMPLAKPGDGDLTAAIKLTEGNISVKGYAVPVQSVEGEMAIRENRVEVRKMSAKAMGGTLEFTGACAFDGKTPLWMKVHGDNIHLARTLKTFSKTGEKPPVAGLVSGDVRFEAPVSGWNKKAKGEGVLALRHGHLPDIPVLGAIENQIFAVGKLVLPIKVTHTDEADLRFIFDGTVVRVQELSARSATLAFRGLGDVDFKGDMNLIINAGPLEKIESKLGKFGDFIGELTDQVSRYHVSGTLGKPQVTLEVGPR